MAATKVSSKEKLDKENGSHIGTWFSLGVVGAVILGTYFVLYGLYMARF